MHNIGNTTKSSSGVQGSGMLPSTTVLPTSPPQQQTITCNNITCREGFYCIEGANICNPSCHTWNQYPRSTNIAIDFLVLTAACIGVVTGVGVLVVAGLRWKKVYVLAQQHSLYYIITIVSPSLYSSFVGKTCPTNKG